MKTFFKDFEIKIVAAIAIATAIYGLVTVSIETFNRL